MKNLWFILPVLFVSGNMAYFTLKYLAHRVFARKTSLTAYASNWWFVYDKDDRIILSMCDLFLLLPMTLISCTLVLIASHFI